MWLLVNHNKPTNTLYWNEYISTVGNYKLASWILQDISQLQNNTVNHVTFPIIVYDYCSN